MSESIFLLNWRLVWLKVRFTPKTWHFWLVIIIRFFCKTVKWCIVCREKSVYGFMWTGFDYGSVWPKIRSAYWRVSFRCQVLKKKSPCACAVFLIRPFFIIHFAEKFWKGITWWMWEKFQVSVWFGAYSKVCRSLLPDIILFHYLVIMITTVCLMNDCCHHGNKPYHIWGRWETIIGAVARLKIWV